MPFENVTFCMEIVDQNSCSFIYNEHYLCCTFRLYLTNAVKLGLNINICLCSEIMQVWELMCPKSVTVISTDCVQ